MPLDERDAEELCGGKVESIDEDAVELEVGFHLRFVEGEARGADSLGVERPVPCRDVETVGSTVELGVDQLLNLGCFASGVGDGGRGEPSEEGRGGGDVFAVCSSNT